MFFLTRELNLKVRRGGGEATEKKVLGLEKKLKSAHDPPGFSKTSPLDSPFYAKFLALIYVAEVIFSQLCLASFFTKKREEFSFCTYVYDSLKICTRFLGAHVI